MGQSAGLVGRHSVVNVPAGAGIVQIVPKGKMTGHTDVLWNLWKDWKIPL